MATKNKHIHQYRRRREGRTDYKSRLVLLKSGEIRLVVRKTLKNIVVQFVKYEPEGDKIIAQGNSQELIKLGWKNSRSNIPSAYLTGILTGAKAKKAGIKKAILDLGSQKSAKQGRIYAVLKGAKESGIDIAAGDDVLPTDERALGKHIEDYMKKPITKETTELKKKILS